MDTLSYTDWCMAVKPIFKSTVLQIRFTQSMGLRGKLHKSQKAIMLVKGNGLISQQTLFTLGFPAFYVWVLCKETKLCYALSNIGTHGLLLTDTMGAVCLNEKGCTSFWGWAGWVYAFCLNKNWMWANYVSSQQFLVISHCQEVSNLTAETLRWMDSRLLCVQTHCFVPRNILPSGSLFLFPTLFQYSCPIISSSPGLL